jgi:hypothetical protein
VHSDSTTPEGKHKEHFISNLLRSHKDKKDKEKTKKTKDKKYNDKKVKKHKMKRKIEK